MNGIDGFRYTENRGKNRFPVYRNPVFISAENRFSVFTLKLSTHIKTGTGGMPSAENHQGTCAPMFQAEYHPKRTRNPNSKDQKS